MKVVKRNGRTEELDVSKIKKYTSESVEGLDNVSLSELEVDAKIQFRDMITTEEIQQTLIKTAVEKIDIDRPNWTFVAARLFLYDLYHRVTGYSGYNTLTEYFARGEKHGRIILGLKEKYDLEDLNKHIKPERDLQFQYLGIKTLYDRYLLKDEKANPIELPQHMFMAIAMFLAQNEKDRQAKAKEFYDVISKFEVMLATPTLSNARTPRHQLSSCFVGSTPDNIEGIFDAYKEMALLSKYGGGIGWDWCKVRAMGGFIDGYKNAAGGLIPFLKIANDLAVAVDQLGCVASNSFVKIIESVETDNGIYYFRQGPHSELYDSDKFKDIRNSFAEKYSKEYCFDYADIDVKSLLSDYIQKYNDSIDTIISKYNISRDQYKKIIGRFKKIKKSIPEGYVLISQDNSFAINKEGHCINMVTLRQVQYRTDRKGYIRVTLERKVHSLHKLLATAFLGEADGLTVDHIDNNKENNSLSNLRYISATENGKKRWLETDKDSFSERIRIIKHLTRGARLQGDRRGTDPINILKINVKVISILDVKAKDIILSYNIETKEPEWKRVTQTHRVAVPAESQVKVTTEDGVFIVTSAWHPSPKVLEDGSIKYVRTDSLKVGDITVGSDNSHKKISSVIIGKKVGYDENFADLSVEGNENYFCSTENGNCQTFNLIHNTRKGAIAVYIEPWHMDVSDFLDLRKNSGEERRRAHELFPALWINDIFMKRVEANANWTLFDPMQTPDLCELYGEAFEKRYIEYENDENVQKNVMPAKELWKKILTSYFETGMPFLGWKDTANIRNPNNHCGIIRSSNLCSEIFQNTSSNHYLIKALFEDGSEQYFEEEYDITVDGGITKKAKKLSSLDSIDGRKIYIVEKEAIDGQTAVCNLASINLSKINSKEDVARVVPIAMRMLDNVIDLNFYPHPKAKKANLASRAVGLGVMGEAQMLAEKNVKWGTSEHLTLIDEVMERVSYYAISASADIAKEKGAYPNFKGSMWSKGIMPINTANEEAKALISRKHSLDWNALREKVKSSGVRNGYMMAIAPTSSISILVGTTQTIEPVYKRKWFEHNLSGMIPNVVPNLSPDTWQFYTPAYELDQRVLVRAGAIRQKWIDQGQSLNIFISLDKASGGYLNEIYSLAWKLGVKSTYYLRSESPDSEKVNNVADRSIECEGCQ